MAPSITDMLVYTPAKDFEMSKRFYTTLGFELTEGWGGTMDCRLGVEDIPAWYEHARKAIDEGDFGTASVSAPEMAGDTPILHVHDPSGVLLIFVG